ERALACARPPGHPDARACGNGQRDVAEHEPARLVGEGDMVERHLAPGAKQPPRVWPLAHVWLFVQLRERPLGALQVALKARDLTGGGLERVVELSQVAHDEQQLAERE